MVFSILLDPNTESVRRLSDYSYTLNFWYGKYDINGKYIIILKDPRRQKKSTKPQNRVSQNIKTVYDYSPNYLMWFTTLDQSWIN